MKFNKLKQDSKKRKLYRKFELFQKIFKLLFLYSHDNLFKLVIFKEKFFKNLYKTKIKNYCIISGRSRSVLKKYKISRITFRILNNDGLFFGIKKAS